MNRDWLRKQGKRGDNHPAPPPDRPRRRWGQRSASDIDTNTMAPGEIPGAVAVYGRQFVLRLASADLCPTRSKPAEPLCGGNVLSTRGDSHPGWGAGFQKAWTGNNVGRVPDRAGCPIKVESASSVKYVVCTFSEGLFAPERTAETASPHVRYLRRGLVDGATRGDCHPAWWGWSEVCLDVNDMGMRWRGDSHPAPEDRLVIGSGRRLAPKGMLPLLADDQSKPSIGMDVVPRCSGMDAGVTVTPPGNPGYWRQALDHIWSASYRGDSHPGHASEVAMVNRITLAGRPA